MLGIALPSGGLAAVGGVWVAAGLTVRSLVRRRKEQAGTGQPERRGPKPPVDARTFALDTLMFLVIGLPALAVGVFRLGIDAADAQWRWLPIVVGGLATGMAVLGGVLYLAGSALTATADHLGAPDRPATITIKAMRETGTYVNERPRLEFDLLVTPEGLATYEVTKKATVPFTAMAALRVGGGFHAKVVGPEKPTVMEIDWDAPIGGDVTTRLAELDRLRQAGTITLAEYDIQRRRVLDSI